MAILKCVGVEKSLLDSNERFYGKRQAMQEQRVNEEFDAAPASYLARREAGAVRYVSHEEAGRRLGMPSR